MTKVPVDNLYGSGVALVGVNHRTLPVAQRESLNEFGRASDDFFNQAEVEHGVVLSTCNRFEVVAAGSANIERLLEFFSKMLGSKVSSQACYAYSNRDAVRHLFRVVSALDSMVLGETQIVGQVKRSYELAQERGRANKLLHHLFQFSFQLSKRVKQHTGLGGRGLSLSYIAVQLVAQIFENFADLNVVVIGSGQMAELVLLHLKSRGCVYATIVNRTLSKARELADRFEAKAVQLESLGQVLSQADVVIGSISAEAPILNQRDVSRYKKEGPLFLIDLGVPRNFSPNISGINEVFLYDIDHLGDFVARNQEFRKEAARDADIVLDYGIIQFEKWLTKLRAEPHALRLRSQILKICADEVDRTLSKSGLVVAQERQIELAHRLGQKLAHQMTEVVLDQGLERLPAQHLLGLQFDDFLDLDS